MSAWLVSNAHIDVLVNALAEHGVLAPDANFRAAGQMLWAENNRSVNYRYSERKRHPHYTLHTTEAPLDVYAVLQAISCYSYQSCERPDWTDSKAHKLVEALREAILTARPELAEPVPSEFDTKRMVPAYTRSQEYDRYPWGFDDLADAQAVRVA